MSFSGKIVSLDLALKQKKNRLPFVVKSVEKLEDQTRQVEPLNPGHLGLDIGTVYLLRNITKIEFVHVRVLPYHDDRAIAKLYGGEFVADHDNFVNKEFLIPRKYPGKLNVVQKLGRYSVYESALQVQEDFPHYIKLEEDAICDKTSGKNRIIPKGSVLKLLGQTQRRIECVERSNLYGSIFKFHLNTQFRSSPVPDTRVYTLQTLVPISLPRVIQFQEVPEENISMTTGDEKEDIRCITSGPIEVLGTKQMEVIVGFAWGQGTRPLTVLVPSGRWAKESILVGNFINETEKLEYIQDNFTIPAQDAFIDRSFYMAVDDKSVIQLRDVEIDVAYGDGAAADCLADVYSSGVHVTNENSSNPQSPTRRNWNSQIPLAQKGAKTVMEELERKAEWFRHIHRDIVKVVQEKTKNGILGIKFFDTEKSQAKQTKEITNSNSAVTTANQPVIAPKPKPPPKPKPYTVGISEGISIKINAKKLQHEDIYEQVQSSVIDQEEEHGYTGVTYETCENEWQNNVVGNQRTPSRKQHTRKPIDRSATEKYNARYVNQKPRSLSEDGYVNQGILHHDPCSRPSDKKEYDYPTVGLNNPSSNEKGAYSKVAAMDLKFIARNGQTSEDFYRYSVNELKECLKMCKMERFADICFEKGFDGKMFQFFDMGYFQKEPFNLNESEIEILKIIIHNGWRPNLGM